MGKIKDVTRGLWLFSHVPYTNDKVCLDGFFWDWDMMEDYIRETWQDYQGSTITVVCSRLEG